MKPKVEVTFASAPRDGLWRRRTAASCCRVQAPSSAAREEGDVHDVAYIPLSVAVSHWAVQGPV